MPELIQISTPFILILGLGIISGLLVFWQYRTTVPEINTRQRSILISLRFIALFILLLVLFKPTLFLRYEKEFIPKTAVYIDQSGSQANLDSILGADKTLKNTVGKIGTLKNVDFFTFNTDVKPYNPKSQMQFSGLTNFTVLFQHINEHPVDQSLVISDGWISDGAYPEKLNATNDSKLFILGRGIQITKTDIFVDDVDYEAVTFLGQVQKIKVRLAYHNLLQRAQLELGFQNNGQTLANKTIYLEPGNAFQTTSFNFTPTKLGLNKLKVFIKNPIADSEPKNDERSFTIQVLKNKLIVNLYSAQADYDGKFIHQILEQSQEIDCRYYLERPDGSFDPNRAHDALDPDIIILINYPGQNSPESHLNHIEQLLLSRKSSLLLFLSSGTDFNRLARISRLLPITRKHPAPPKKDVSGFRVESHPILRLFKQNTLNESFWKNAPPIMMPKFRADLKDGTKILIQNQDQPVVLQYAIKGYRNITFLGSAFWRWHFLLQNNQQFSQGYGNLLKNSLRWLSETETLKPVQLSLNSKETNPGNILQLKGIMYDNNFSRIKQGQIHFYLENASGQNQILAQPDSAGNFQAQYTVTETGRIRVIAEGAADNHIIGRDTVIIESLPLNKEFLESGINTGYLSDIALKNGGKYFASGQLDSLVNTLTPAKKNIIGEQQIDLWQTITIMLIIFIAVLLEWLLRKRFGLV